MSRYHEVYQSWKRDPIGFWAAAAEEIDWIRPATKIFDARQGQYGRWFAGAQCNTAVNCLDRHVITGRRPNQLALIYDSPMTGTKRTYTYAELTDDVAADVPGPTSDKYLLGHDFLWMLVAIRAQKNV